MRRSSSFESNASCGWLAPLERSSTRDSTSTFDSAGSRACSSPPHRLAESQSARAKAPRSVPRQNVLQPQRNLWEFDLHAQLEILTVMQALGSIKAEQLEVEKRLIATDEWVQEPPARPSLLKQAALEMAKSRPSPSAKVLLQRQQCRQYVR